MKTKDEVYVVVDTPKKAKKLKKVLDMFGENIYSDERDFFNWCKTSNTVYFSLNEDEWHYKIGNVIGREEVSIKELRNILAKEHLRPGDVIIAGIGEARYVVKFENTIINEAFIYASKYICIDDDGFNHFVQNGGNFTKFIRYASEEEKALLEPKKELGVGKWYKSPKGGLFCVTSFNGDEYEAYGFNTNGSWKGIGRFHKDFAVNDVEATPQEVEQALIEEAKRRGYKYGDKLKSLCMGTSTIGKGKYNYRPAENILAISGNWLFKDGVWAEVIEKAEESIKPKVGDVCKFWDNNENIFVIGRLNSISDSEYPFEISFGNRYDNAKPLTKQEVIDLLFNE